MEEPKKPNDDDVIVLQSRITEAPLIEDINWLRVVRGYRDSEMVREAIRCLARRERTANSHPPEAHA